MLTAALRPLQVLALSLLCGGLLSNLLDRVVLGGSVTDFLNIRLGCLQSNIFNLADVAVISGVLLYVMSLAWNLCSSAYHRSHQAKF